MNTLGSHPGAILFRMSVMAVVIALLLVAFFDYLDDTEKALERAAIERGRTLIDSELAVVFARHAIRGELDALAQFAGGNPFALLAANRLGQVEYRGELGAVDAQRRLPGWYYDAAGGQVIYLPRFLDRQARFDLSLRFDDVDGDGRFDRGADRPTGLALVAAG